MINVNTPDDIKRAKRFEQIKMNLLNNIFNPVSNVYIDLTMMKDTKLGLMLSQATPEQRQYIYSCLDKYNSTYICKDSFTFCFPKLAHLEQKYQDDYKQYTDDAINYAPDTMLFLQLYDILKTIDIHNAQSQSNIHPMVTINTYPYQPTKLLLLYLQILNKAFSSITKFSYITKDPLHMTTWSSYQTIFINNVAPMVSVNSSPWKALAEDENWKIKTSIYAAPYISDDTYNSCFDDIEPEKRIVVASDHAWQDECLNLTEETMQLFSDFHFYPNIVPLVEKSHG